MKILKYSRLNWSNDEGNALFQGMMMYESDDYNSISKLIGTRNPKAV